MPSDNTITVASAGSGKTTYLVKQALEDAKTKKAIITFTNNNSAEISKKLYEHNGFIPDFVTVDTWFSFLLKHFVRPYQNFLHAPRISHMNFVSGRSAKYEKEKAISKHYFSSDNRIYSDKITKFAYRIIEKSDGRSIHRFEKIFDELYIDESQDLAGYDFELIESLLKSGVSIKMAGDHRQATYATNNAAMNKRYCGVNIVKKFLEWEKQELVSVKFHNHSYRCVQGICNFADRIYPQSLNTKSLNENITGHDGVFVVRQADVDEYIRRFAPQVLRYNKRTEVSTECPINFGSSKGMTFDRVLIYPHGPLKALLKTGNFMAVGNSPAKVYVAITRASQSTSFVFDDEVRAPGISKYEL